MVIELVAGRVVSSYLGMSLYTWTAIIGVIMTGMTAGNFLGGWLADRFRPQRTLAAAFVLSAAAVVALLPLNEAAGNWQTLRTMTWPLRIFCHITLVFSLPGLLLGVINPVVAKMALNSGQATGVTIGRVFACGAAGSILGTFAAGYFLILTLGVQTIVAAMAAALGALGLCYAVAALREGASPAQKRFPQGDAVSSGSSAFAALGPSLTVFVSNAAFMTLELAASRVVSRQFGSSLYTWTAVIGIVLAGVTFGNYAGGRIADRVASRKTLASLFACASIASVAAALGGTALGGSWDLVYGLLALPWPLQIATFMTIVYFIPCFFLGTISPLVIKVALKEDHTAGRVVGAIYAWGSAGAIVGTFSAGYFLIDWMGMVAVILLVALVLAVAGLVHAPDKMLVGAWMIAASAIFIRVVTLPSTGANVIYKEESNYSYIEVLAQEGSPDVRRMVLDKLVHSLVNVRDPLSLSYPYEWVYQGVLDRRHPAGAPIRALVLGGGGFTFPRYLEVARPGSYVEVAEIDPAVTHAAHEAFGFPRDTSVAVFNMDARNRVEDILATDGGAERFDYVFGDSINDYSVPYHLTTREFAANVHAILKPDGVYMLNLIDVLDSGRFVAAAVGSCAAVFEHVQVFSTLGVPDKRDTFVVISSDEPLDLSGVVADIQKTNAYAGRLLDSAEVDALLARTGRVVLTDNYAPVENLLAPVAGTRQGGPAEIRYQLARRYAMRDWYGAAEAQMRKALALRPDWAEAQTFLAWLQFVQERLDESKQLLGKLTVNGGSLVDPWVKLGGTRIDQGDLAEGAALLAAAVELEPMHAEAQTRLGEVSMQVGRMDIAIQHWNLAIVGDPKNVEVLRQLGNAHAAGQQFDQAIGYWRRALVIQPQDPETTHNLIAALVVMGRISEAAAALGDADLAGVHVDKALHEQILSATEK